MSETKERSKVTLEVVEAIDDSGCLSVMCTTSEVVGYSALGANLGSAMVALGHGRALEYLAEAIQIVGERMELDSSNKIDRCKARLIEIASELLAAHN